MIFHIFLAVNKISNLSHILILSKKMTAKFLEVIDSSLLSNLSTSLLLLFLKETTLERASAVNVFNRGKGEKNVYYFLSFQFLSAVVPVILS